MAREGKERQHGFIGRIYKTLSDDIGFIRPNAIWRMDSGNIGLDVDDDVFVHINAFSFMEKEGYRRPDRLKVGMIIAFFIGPSRNKEGRVTAEYCTVYENSGP